MIRRSVQGVGDFGEDFGAAMLLARCFTEPGRFEQAAQLTNQNGSFGGEVFVEKSFIGIMQEGRRADNFVENHQRSGHYRACFKLLGRRECRACLHFVDEDGAATPHGVGGNGALRGEQAESDETLGQFAIGLFSDEFAACPMPPEINSADLKELARGAAEKLDERGGVGALRSFGGDSQEKFLKAIIGVGRRAALRQRDRVTFKLFQGLTASRIKFYKFSQVIESIGKLFSNLNLSQEKWGDGCLSVKSRDNRAGGNLRLRNCCSGLEG
jgi:hypothetical protein